MKTLIIISWRNIWRNRTRSIIIILALVLGIMGGIFSAAMRLTAEQQQMEDALKNQISHIQIHHPGFVANPEASYSIPRGSELAEELEQMDNIWAVSARTVFDGMAASANMNAGVRIKGVNPDSEAHTTSLDELLEEGTYFTGEGRLPGVIIGRELANDLNCHTGSRMVLTFQDKNNNMVHASFRVEGIYTMTSKDFERRTIFAHREVINSHIDHPDAVTEIAILLNDMEQYRQAAREFQEVWPDLKVRHWAQLAPSRYHNLEILDQVLIWILVIILLAISFGLLNTILMSILERVNELGLLMALGMKRSKVFSMVMLETAMIAIIGGILGLLSSYAMIQILNTSGVRLPGAEGMEEFGYASVLYPDIPVSFYFETAVVVIIFAILAAIYPAWKAIKIPPAQAVRQE